MVGGGPAGLEAARTAALRLVGDVTGTIGIRPAIHQAAAVARAL